MSNIWKPHTTVAAMIEKEHRFLLVEERILGKQVYNQPAGHLEPGESLLQAVIRETQEETARDFTPEYISGIYRWDQPETKRCFIRVTFAGQCDNHQADRMLDDGIIQALWLTRDEISARAEKLRSPMVLRCIDDYLAGKRYPLELITDI